MKGSSTTGANLLDHFENRPDSKRGEPFRFSTRGKGVDRRGEPVYNDFLLLAVSPTVRNRNFAQVKAQTNTGNILYFPITFNDRYNVPEWQ